MKKKTKIIVITSVCMAVVAAGGIAVYRRNRDRITIDDPQIGEMISDQAKAEPDNLHLNLTGLTVDTASQGTMGYFMYAGRHMICSSDMGYYFCANNAKVGNHGIPTMFYADRATQTTIPLCPRPNCLHDGSLYCTATTMAYTFGAPVYAKDGVYAQALKYRDPEKHDGAATQVLLRYEPDGSSITEVATLGSGSRDYSEIIAPPTIYRGYAFCIVQQPRPDLDITADTMGTFSTGFAIVGCELATGKTVTLFETYPDVDATSDYLLPMGLYGYDNGIYFSYGKRYDVGNLSPDLKQGVYRISLRSGELKRLSTKVVDYISHGMTLRQGYSKTDASKTCLYLANIGSEEDILLGEGLRAAIADEHAVYAYDPQSSTIRVFDFSGTETASVPVQEDVGVMSLAVQDGQLYVNMYGQRQDNGDVMYAQGVSDRIMQTDLAAALAGKPEWKLCYDLRLIEYLEG